MELDEIFEIEDVECVWESDTSIGIENDEIFDDTVTLYKNQIHEDSDVKNNGDCGMLRVTMYVARKKGWV